MPRDAKGTRVKGWTRGNERFGPVETQTEIVSDGDDKFHSCWWKAVDWHWHTKIERSEVFSSVKNHHSIATAWHTSSSRSWRCNPQRRYHWGMQEGIHQCSALVNWHMDISSGKRWRRKEEVPMLFESESSTKNLVPSSNSTTFWRYRYWSCIPRQCTVTLSSTSITSETQMNWGQQLMPS